MPEGTKVDHLYKKLLSEGHSEESAARIAQSVTGEALATGKTPPKHENHSEHFKNGELRGRAYLKALGMKIDGEIQNESEAGKAVSDIVKKTSEMY